MLSLINIAPYPVAECLIPDYADYVLECRPERFSEPDKPGAFIRRQDDPFAKLGSKNLILDLEILYLFNKLRIDQVGDQDEKRMKQSDHNVYLHIIRLDWPESVVLCRYASIMKSPAKMPHLSFQPPRTHTLRRICWKSYAFV